VVFPSLDLAHGELRVEVHDKDPAMDSDEFLGGAVLDTAAITAGVTAGGGEEQPNGRALLSSATEHTLPLQPKPKSVEGTAGDRYTLWIRLILCTDTC
jgi:hypothetical protein